MQVLQSTSEAMTAKQLAQAALDQGLISSSNKVQTPLVCPCLASSMCVSVFSLKLCSSLRKRLRSVRPSAECDAGVADGVITVQ